MAAIRNNKFQNCATADRMDLEPANMSTHGIIPMKLPPISLSTGPRYCPFCNSDDILHSRRRDIIDFVVLPLAMLRPFRCMDCDCRYYGFFFAKRVSPATSPSA
jgi:hypothetical protein